MNLEPTTTERPKTAAKHLAELRGVVQRAGQGRKSQRTGAAHRLWLQHTLCVLCARAVRAAAWHWRNGRDPRPDRPTFGLHWRTVWARWMEAAASQRALAKWHYAALRGPRRH